LDRDLAGIGQISDADVVSPTTGKAMLSRLLFSALVLAGLMKPCLAQDMDDSLLAFAVNIHRTPVQTWPGYGIYLGQGLFLTAAHVVGRAWMTRPKVVIAGQDYPTRTIKEGSFEGTDLTLLAVDENLLPMRVRLRQTKLCKKPPWPGEQVVTVVPKGTARSHVISPERLPVGARKFSTVIADVDRTGNSGSGVFDAQQRCLLGIMSRKISQSRTLPGSDKTETRDIAKYFVPASEIASFLPAGLPF
jgi:hypothetical protein